MRMGAGISVGGAGVGVEAANAAAFFARMVTHALSAAAL